MKGRDEQEVSDSSVLAGRDLWCFLMVRRFDLRSHAGARTKQEMKI